MKLISFLFLLILISCSQVQMIKPPQTSTQLVSREDSREKSEKERVLEYYRLLRARNWKKIQSGEQVKSPRVQVRTYQSPAPEIKIKQVNEDEQKIEIDQNLVYFCMDQRKNPKFSNEEHCLEYASQIFDNCQGEFEFGDARLTTCVKSRLR